MRSRSHRVRRVETHDDWGEGPWTVDCLCGVTFDDGKEMVKCDVCSVWVHTRCSGYVKSDKLFVCDTCKGMRSRKETEVAQLLVDLPNKKFPNNDLNLGEGYTEVSTEKKVHVHGVPGGDPSLFAGLSSIFSPQLWKCTGYVPKKINFQYKEFPSWDEKEVEQVERRNHKGTDNAAENGDTAGVLFSLFKDSATVKPLGSSEDVKRVIEDGTTGKGGNSVHINSSGENKVSSFANNDAEKDSSLVQAAVVDSLKHKKKDRGSSKDHRERKRTGTNEKGKDFKKKARIFPTASTISSVVNQRKFDEDRGPEITKVYTESSKSGDSKHLQPEEDLSNGPGISTNNDKKHAAADEHDMKTKTFDSSRCYTNGDGKLKEDSTGDKRESKIENSYKVASGTLDSPNVDGGGSAQRILTEFQKAQPEAEDMAVSSREVIESKNIQGLIGDASCFVPNAGVETGADKNLDVLNVHHSPSSEGKLEGLKLSAQVEVPAINLFENIRKSDLVISRSETTYQMQDADKSTAGGNYRKDDTQADGYHSKLELPTGSGVRDGSSGHQSCSTGTDGSLGGRKSSSQLKSSSKYVEGACKLGVRTYSSEPNHLKELVGKSSSEAYKTSTSASPSARNVPSLTTSSKHMGMLNGNLGNRRDTGSSGGVKDEGRIERLKKIMKDIPKSSISPVSKVSQSSRFSHGSDPKQSSLHSSPKVMAPTAAGVSGFGQSCNSLKTAGASNAHNKVLGSGLPEKCEKISHPDSQPSSNVNASKKQPPASSNPQSGLSDEELALLLHQELNSSPRVPRVPRTRHAGSLPQLTSPTASSMLKKRTSSSGDKDFIFSGKRKSKESGQDVADEANKVERVSPSPDHRGKYSEITTNPLTKGEVESGIPKDLARKNKPPAPTATTSSGLSSSAEVYEYKVSSTRNSPRHTSDGDSGAVAHPTPLTLPGLIAKIMSKGERMTLEELCNAVLPHWPHLRKHNGEPYAYSSHSHGVLDCLRNRTEWARLVDRGPKTNSGKKRRKPDAARSGAETEDDVRRERTTKDGRNKSLECQREEFPKGKRQARKRRRLAINGRGIKEFRRRRRAEVSDDEDASLSNSSGDGTSGTNEASASSDETRD